MLEELHFQDPQQYPQPCTRLAGFRAVSGVVSGDTTPVGRHSPSSVRGRAFVALLRLRVDADQCGSFVASITFGTSRNYFREVCPRPLPLPGFLLQRRQEVQREHGPLAEFGSVGSRLDFPLTVV